MKKIMIVVFIACLFALSSSYTDACTVFRLKANDGSIIVGRSMEFAVDLKYDAVVVPRNKAYVSFAPDGKEGLSWKTRYGYVGIGSFGMEYGISDGMNEKGLAIGLLWFESDMKWQDVALLR